MANVDVKMVAASMQEAIKAFSSAEKQINHTMSEMNKIAKQMEDGALVGDGGTALREAIQQKLVKRLSVIEAKMQEMQKDLKGAYDATIEGVTTAQSRFKN